MTAFFDIVFKYKRQSSEMTWFPSRVRGQKKRYGFLTARAAALGNGMETMTTSLIGGTAATRFVISRMKMETKGHAFVERSIIFGLLLHGA